MLMTIGIILLIILLIPLMYRAILFAYVLRIAYKQYQAFNDISKKLNTLGTITGRFSGKEPNLKEIPRRRTMPNLHNHDIDRPGFEPKENDDSRSQR